MVGLPNDDEEQYVVVAAAAGTVMKVEDSYDASATNEDDNNYLWIAHANGEWTKYTHLEEGSVTALGRAVGQFVLAGTPLGAEGSVGARLRVHLHFEVAVPDDPTSVGTALSATGFVRGQTLVPLVCGIAGNVLLDGQTHVAGPC